MFMSNETQAMKIIDQFNQEAQGQRKKGLLQNPSNITDVVAFFTFDSNGNPGGYGDESKWTWMINIADNSFKAYLGYGNYTLGWNATGLGTSSVTPIANSKGQNTILYQMMMYAERQRGISSAADAPPLTDFNLIYYSQEGVSKPVTVGGINVVVTVWQVVY
jgi:hypothetical protein